MDRWNEVKFWASSISIRSHVFGYRIRQVYPGKHAIFVKRIRKKKRMERAAAHNFKRPLMENEQETHGHKQVELHLRQSAFRIFDCVF